MGSKDHKKDKKHKHKEKDKSKKRRRERSSSPDSGADSDEHRKRQKAEKMVRRAGRRGGAACRGARLLGDALAERPIWRGVWTRRPVAVWWQRPAGRGCASRRRPVDRAAGPNAPAPRRAQAKKVAQYWDKQTSKGAAPNK
jgi:hypothetical protein